MILKTTFNIGGINNKNIDDYHEINIFIMNLKDIIHIILNKFY